LAIYRFHYPATVLHSIGITISSLRGVSSTGPCRRYPSAFAFFGVTTPRDTRRHHFAQAHTHTHTNMHPGRRLCGYSKSCGCACSLAQSKGMVWLFIKSVLCNLTTVESRRRLDMANYAEKPYRWGNPSERLFEGS
jgi:hypothetical protein